MSISCSIVLLYDQYNEVKGRAEARLRNANYVSSANFNLPLPHQLT